MKKLNNSSKYYQITDKVKNNEENSREELTDFMVNEVKDDLLEIIIDLDLNFEEDEINGLIYSMVKEYVVKSSVYENFATYKANVIRSVEAKLFKQKRIQSRAEREVMFDHSSEDMDKEIVANDAVVDPDDYVIKEELKKIINDIINKLSAREITVIKQYFGFDGLGVKSSSELGEKYGISHQRISQIVKKSLRKIRYYLSNSETFDKDMMI